MSDLSKEKASLSDSEAPKSPPITPHSKPILLRAAQSCGHIPKSGLEGLKQTRNECLLRMETLEKRIKRYREERDKYRKSFQEREIIKQEATPRKSKDVTIKVEAQGTFSITDDKTVKYSEYHKTPYELFQCGDLADSKDNNQIATITTGTKLIMLHKASNVVKLTWSTPPKSVLIIKKPYDTIITSWLFKLGTLLQDKYKVKNIYVEKAVHDELKCYQFLSIEGIDELEKHIDFLVVLGGDGTMCYTSYRFQEYCPPIISFAMGSLGFLTPIDISSAEEQLESVVNKACWITLRTRLIGKIVRNDKSLLPPSEKDYRIELEKDKTPVNLEDGCPVDSSDFHIDNVSDASTVLNEFVIQRESTNMVDLDCYIFKKKITKIIADGVIVATPTGSTAYSASAGGSMVHPAVPAMLLTPICPHSLSFRPMILPDSALLRVTVAKRAEEECRNSAIVICDGRKWAILNEGDSLYISVSTYPLPTIITGGDNIINGGVTGDWFISIQRELRWNERKEQKPLPPEFDPGTSIPTLLRSTSTIKEDIE